MDSLTTNTGKAGNGNYAYTGQLAIQLKYLKVGIAGHPHMKDGRVTYVVASPGRFMP